MDSRVSVANSSRSSPSAATSRKPGSRWMTRSRPSRTAAWSSTTAIRVLRLALGRASGRIAENPEAQAVSRPWGSDLISIATYVGLWSVRVPSVPSTSASWTRFAAVVVGLPLLWKVVLTNAAVLVTATIVLALGPFTVSVPVRLTEVLVLLAGLLAMLVINLVLLSRTLHPLRDLTHTMHRVDLLEPGRRVEVRGAGPDVQRLTTAFNSMIERLEDERRESAAMALTVQEGERQRIARELHDEVGQTLTAMLLQIQGIHADAPEDLRGELDELRETARAGAEDVRRIAQRLRPEALEELGLQSALVALSDMFAEQTGVRVSREIEADLP